MVHSIIADLDSWHPRVHVDVFQVMPDHIHAIVVLRGAPATTSTTGFGASRDDETVGAGPRACPRDEPGHAPSRRRVAPSPDRPRDEPGDAPSRRRVAPSPVQHQPTYDTHNPSDASQSDDRETTRRGILDGSAHPGCRGQARGPAPTVASSRDAPNPVVDVVADVSSSRDATNPVVDVVARVSSSRDATNPVVDVVARAVTLGDVVQHIKSLTTARYRHAVMDHGWPRFHGRLWQRNYYERIIRDKPALMNIRRYIRANPRNWVEPRRRYS